ncbi:sterol desaturase family protein [Gymnodinialimonas sp. 2305UL16-5]|uniref:sterol desaturase family protein n=1 Tax=Gymnodinialimonas mytili TaxID=3126503 RepID=UPI0030954D86
MDQIVQFLEQLAGTAVSFDMRISGPFILSTIILSFGIWWFTARQGDDRKSFLSFLLPKDVYAHKSNLLDIKLYLTNRLIAFLGVTGALVFTPVVAYKVLVVLTEITTGEWQLPPQTWTRVAIATLLIVMASDFCKYWAHRLHHEWDALWPFHAVHHSAEVLTPLTVARAHPIEGFIRLLFISVFVGVLQGVLVWAFVGTTSPITIAGANVFYFIFNAAGGNLRHSHIWLSYGRIVEHIFISPAQHQIHHSRATEHFNKNYGSMFAIWDWMFGTLYVPAKRETLTFGVAEADGTPIQQPYETLGAALFKPFIESSQAIFRSWRRRSEKRPIVERRASKADP